ncbi:hypothetical protein [Pseudobacteriovorax antillogorgiicola]|uniref:Orotate phosphoribosyltransferase n=1 Tax=Pseudobacteriovorax antillogorgiicola TaxID=1513793 RepID=A0A1Y6BC23_9BACT|nr:hypothetical protein [Pseudobacteriovorax antillogorgiicola]TCS58656.1 orotate phosphoribosyltransferase [Pseudobacteriovorax antillogorgiicola]SME96274.1 orotate phosphoribosyltransferase [Pseudobacteriovorax antillogorgiicola]
MTSQTFDSFILKHQIIGFFDEAITLKSGRESHFYVNWRQATNDAFLLNQLTDFIRDFLLQNNLAFDSLIGVPEGASKTAVITAMKIAQASPTFAKGSHIIPMGRAKPKQHGAPQDKYFIGQPKGRTVVLEDTITTGLSLVEFLHSLQSSGVEVVAALGLTDRMETRDDGRSVAQYVHDEFDGRIQYLTMSDATKLLPQAIRSEQPSDGVVSALLQEFERYGVKPLDLEAL